jgi:glycosyltransferase involved in cell wall biosynthesis
VRICLSVTNDIVTDQRVNRTARSLIRLSADVTVVGRKRKNSPGLTNAEVRFRRFSLIFNKGPLFYACYNVRLFFYLLFHQFDLLVANDLDALPANFMISKIKKAILVYDSHEYFTEVPELINRNFVRKIWEKMEKWMVPKIIHSYTVCDSIAEIYNKKYGTSMIAIRNLPYGHSGSPEFKIKEPWHEKIIIYQGSVNKGRGLELVIKSMQYLENVRFWIIGDGDIINDLRRLVNKSKLESKILFKGRMLPGELIQYTVQADVGISLEENLGLNYYYALPNKLFDYISAGVPVLVSDFPEMGSLVKKYDIGMATLASDPQELATILKSMLHDSGKIRRWKNNLQKAASELCWENEEKKLLDFYREIISP